MFRGLEELKLPDKKRNGPTRTYDCDLCDSGDWLSETEVDIHKRSMHMRDLQVLSAQENICLDCGKENKDKDSLICHIKSVHLFSSPTARRIEREVFICDYCHCLFFNKELLGMHIVHKHRNNVVLPCLKCHLKLRPRLVYRHLSSKHQLQSVSMCPLCATRRADRAELAEHVKARHAKYYQCGVCGNISTKERDFNLHLNHYKRRPKDPTVTKYAHFFAPPSECMRPAFLRHKPILGGFSLPSPLSVCVVCRELCEQDDMLDHVARDHSSASLEGRALYACTCGETFANRILLKYHIFKMGADHVDISKVKPTEQAPSEAPEAPGDDEDKEERLSNEAPGDDEDKEERYLVIVMAEDETTT